MDVSFLHIVVVFLPTLPLHQSTCNECEYDVDITFLVPASSDLVVVAGVVVCSSCRRVRHAI
jgi:hypothetical protein